MVAHNEQPDKAAPGPKEYSAAGFRILPIASDGSKRPLVSGFGADAPGFTVAPENFQPRDGVAILTGPCPGLGADWLAVLDLDGDTSVGDIEAFTERPLPPTLSSKGYRHLYYRIPPSPERDALRQWVRMFGRGDDVPEVDLKWAGGYAIEPSGSWDGAGWDPARIAVLPAEWIRQLLEIRGVTPGAPVQATPRVAAARVELGDLESFRPAIEALASCWPQPGEGCHEAALALGGVLGNSGWSEDDIARFAGALFLASGTKNRVSDVLTSVSTRRAGGECKGWPTLKSLLKDAAHQDAATVDAALLLLKKQVPGLAAPKAHLPSLDKIDVSRVIAAQVRAKAGRGEVKQLVFGSDDEIAGLLRDHTLQKEHTVYDSGEIWSFDAETGVWSAMSDAELHEIITVYDGAEYLNPEGKAKRVQMGAGKVSSVRHCLEAKLAQPGFFAEAPRGIAFQNGFLKLPSREFVPLTADLRARWRLSCDFGLDAARKHPPVNWVRFLRSVWGDDRESIALVHQMLGYLLSGRTDMQKIFVFLGPKRAGKGTLGNLIEAIFRDKCAGFKLSSLDQHFGMEHFIGKSVLIDDDVRRSDSRFKSEGMMVERLLSISSNAIMAVPRKGRPDLSCRLGGRMVLMANPPFGPRDPGGALASRFIILTFPKSFFGQEDLTLGERLEKEIPSIVALALDGLDKLDAVGKFIEPASSAEERAAVENAQNPMLAFLEEMCELDPEADTASDELWAAAQRWREANGHKKMASQSFEEFLRQRGIKKIRPQANGERLPRVYRGIRLRVQGRPGASTPRLIVVPDPGRPVGSKKAPT
jgi:P4 family phage/plasmid primase-like protien